MRTHADTAILVVDMLNDFVLPDAPMRVAGAAATVPAIAAFLAWGRARGWAVIYINR
ncbi:MAG: isochorismatase family protein, partial [Desulfovibrio sp.]|nr:isochorismatase family protein [Desulfovibrio sp.]